MKRKRFLFALIFIQVILLFASVGVFLNFQATVGDAYASGYAQPESLVDLQNAEDAQFDYWAENLSRFDGRDFDYITPERNQLNLGICWAYAAIGAMEANILRDGVDPDVDKSTLDLDEIIAAYVRYNRDGADDPLYLTTNDTYDSSDWRSSGGFAHEAFLAMTQGYSPDEQSTTSGYQDWAIKQRISPSKYFVQGFKQVDSDREAIKRAILEYGAVTMEYKAPQNIFQKYLYYSDGTSLGHASLIVGWDDNVPSSVFSPNKPVSNGAWIVKNSWGPGGDDGVNGTCCFYLSYDSYMSSNLYVVDMALRENYENIYFYDGRITENTIQYYADAYGAIYEAKLSSATEREQLVATSFGIRNSKATVDIAVYKLARINQGNVNDKINSPDSGVLIAEKKGVYFEDDGFYTVDFDKPIELEQGEFFSIVISGKDEQGNMLNPVFAFDDVESVNDMTYRKYMDEWTSFKYAGGYYADASSGLCVRLRAITNTVPRERPLENDIKYARLELSNRLLYYKKGVSQTPELTVFFGDTVLKENVDYELTYLNNQRPGQATVEIIGINDYFGERTTNFEIATPKYPPGVITETIEVYNDINRLSQIDLPDGWKWQDEVTLKAGLSDFGYQMKYTGDDADCYQYISYSVRIYKYAEPEPEKWDISGATVTMEGKYYYTGEQIVPSTRVVYKGHQLTAGVDYTLSGQSNVDAGLATLVVSGTGRYFGQKSLTFEIKKAMWPKLRPLGKINVGEEITKLSQVPLDCNNWVWQDGSRLLTEKTESAYATYIGNDLNNYINTKMRITVVRGAQIERKDIASIDRLELKSERFVYDGGEKTPEVIATDEGKALIDGEDFSATYFDNVNAGQGHVIVRGKNNYYGTQTLYFAIDRAERDAFEVVMSGWTYGDENVPEPHVEGVMDDAAATYAYSSSQSGAYVATKPTQAGVYWVKATVAASQNYNVAEAIASFAISKAAHPALTPSPSVTVPRKTKTLRSVGLPAGWNWEDPDARIDSDSVVAWAEYSDKQNYETYRAQVTILKEPPKHVSQLQVRLSSTVFVYDGNAKTPDVIATDGAEMLDRYVDYDVTYEDNRYVGEGKATVTFKNDYNGSIELTFAINRAEKPVADTTIRLTKTPSSLREIELPAGFIWADENAAISAGETTAKAIYVGDDADCYETTELYFKIVVAAQDVRKSEDKGGVNKKAIIIATVTAAAAIIAATAIAIAVRKRSKR